MQFEEHVGLHAQHVRVDGLVQKVHGAAFVATELPVLLARAGRDEDQRNVASALAAPDQFGQFEAVHVGHLHVQQGQGDVAIFQQQLKRFRAGLRLQHLDPAAIQQRFQRHQVFGHVVDQQAFDSFFLWFGGCQEHGVKAVLGYSTGCVGSWDSMAAISSGVRASSTARRANAAFGMVGMAADDGACTTVRPPAA
ncbi:hypothetical protein D3C72_1231410 [compost metagenome]